MNLLLFNLRVDRDHTALGFTTDWINEIATHFEQVTVITMYRGVVDVADNVEVMSAGLEHGWSKPRRVLAFYRCLFKALRARRYDCCFAHMMPLFTLLAGPVLKAGGIPVALWYAHNHKSPILPAALAFSDRALASTKAGFPIATDKLRVIGQGIDTGRFRPAAAAGASNMLRLLTVGRFSRVKNLDLMIRAFAQLRNALPDLACGLAFVGEALSEGDRDYAASCRRLSEELGVANAIEWRPPVSFARIHEVYRTGDVFLSACASGLDKTILEAMASGVPVVAMHPMLACALGPYFADGEESFARALIDLARLTEGERRTLGLAMRDYVCQEHSLAQLGRRVADNLKEIAK